MRVLVFLVLLPAIAAFSQLTVPNAWNPFPSQTAPCGGAKGFATSQVKLLDNQQFQFQWKVFSPEGEGVVFVGIDPFGGINFQPLGPATVVSTPTGGLGIYSLKVTVPNTLVCTGGVQGNLCSIQMYTQSGWFSCSTVTSDRSVPINNQTVSVNSNTCESPPSLAFCAGTDAITQQVMIANNPTLQQTNGLASMDQLANETFLFMTQSNVVFANYNQLSCQSAYRRFLCAEAFPKCTGSGLPCRSACYAVLDNCNVNSTHISLFNCATNTNFGNSSNSDSISTCPACTGNCQPGSLSGANYNATTSLFTFLMIISMYFNAFKEHEHHHTQ